MKKSWLLYFLFLQKIFALYGFSNPKQYQLAIEPQQNPSIIKFTDITAYSFNVHFNKQKDATSYLVLCSLNGTISSKPTDGNSYLKGDKLGNAKIAYVGNDTLFSPTGIRANQLYTYYVFSFNGSNGQENYQLTTPLKGYIQTKGLSINYYYDGIARNAPNFIQALHELINPHLVITYSNYKSTLLNNIELIDTIVGKKYIQCVYTGEKRIIDEPFDWNKEGYSREHSFPHSWMPSHPADAPALPEYSDLHNLYPTNLAKANSIRSNYPLGEINGKVTYEYLEGKLGYFDNKLVYEPRDAQKGNVARSMFYMCIAYNGINNKSWTLPSYQDQEILKKWHFQDPPDSYEIARQEYIYFLQGNRNPFIDSALYVCNIDFLTTSPTSSKCNNLLNFEKLESDVSYLPYSITKDDIINLEINKNIQNFDLINISGDKIKSEKNSFSLKNGMYFLVVYDSNYNKVFKIYINDL